MVNHRRVPHRHIPRWELNLIGILQLLNLLAAASLVGVPLYFLVVELFKLA